MTKLLKVWFALFCFLTINLAALPSSVIAALANVSHAYHANEQITAGDLVSLDPQKVGYVDLASVNNGSRLTGVAVDASQSLLAVNPSSAMVQVATTGNVDVLVSTVNGDIAVGDQISVSPFDGIGMKADPGLNVIGLAQTALTSKTASVTKQEVRNKQGQLTTVWVGYVSLTINVSTASTNGSETINSLQKIVQNLTGHVVPTYRIIIGLIVAIITLLALIAIVYAAIYGSIVSIGRNPLAKRSVYHTLSSVVGMTLLVALVASVTIYLLIT